MCKQLIYLVSFVLVLGLVGSVGWADEDLLVDLRAKDLPYGTGVTTWRNRGTLGDFTANGTPVVEDVDGRKAVTFDSSSWFEGPTSVPGIEGDGARSIEVWAYNPEMVGEETMVSWAHRGGPSGTNMGFNYSNNESWGAVGHWGGAFDMGYAGAHSPAPTVGMWWHLVYTYDGTTARIYVNAEEETVLAVALNTHSGNVIRVAAQSNIAGTDIQDGLNFIGSIAEVRIYNRALTPEEIQQAMIGVPPGAASNPSPADAATDVPREVVLNWTPGEFAAPTNGHKVYFGESFDDVNDAIGGIAQDANSYAPPQRLDFGTTYYWRIDEVNAPPTSQIEFKSEVWSFTTELIAYAIENITATASSAHQTDAGPENTINGLGLDANDLHSIEPADMWLSFDEPNGTWIEYEFDKVHKLHEMWVWNHNGMLESVLGFGFKDVTIEYSTNGTDYTTLGTTHEFARAPGADGYAHNTTIDFGGVTAKYVRLTTNSNWGAGLLDQYGLSEVRFFSIPVFAREPSPDSGTTDVAVDVTLGFRAGREADKHDVYLSTDEQAVIDGNVPVTTVTEASYGPLSLDLGTTYYWKINEVNEAETPTTWQGEIWNFSTHEFFVVDGFEDYNDYPPDEIWATWVDGYGVQTNGATSGYPNPDWNQGEHYVETAIVHGGDQAMPFFYDNSIAAYSEATVNIADLAIGSDWAGNGVKTLSLWFSGDVNNVPEQMYVKLNGVKVVYDGDADNIRKSPWQVWNIHLADFAGVNLSNVTELSIGFERIGFSGGSGMVLFDDIRLYPFERQLITPVEPSVAGLVAHYEFEGTTNDSSGNGLHGTAMGEPTFVAGNIGQAISLDGIDDYVTLPIDSVIDSLTSSTFTTWVDFSNAGGAWQRIFDFGSGTSIYIFLCPRTDTGGPMRLAITTGGGGGESLVNSTDTLSTGWHHVAAVVKPGSMQVYLDGMVVASGSTSVVPSDLGKTTNNWLGRSQYSTDGYFRGSLDDFRIYDYALSDAEIAWLAGVTKPFDKPF
ncbi:MAG: discoidin domain-containing protein [Planctomycetes bacterium]|nr:discoidin domain-containing protein [Planctomycetota bacterium]